jgi:phosphoribosylcarboxyaminoimidazole (NCAIR) mutase
MKNCTVVIVGTKSDDADVQVPEEALTKFARDVEACSFVISAHTGDGFDSMLNYTIESIIKKFKIR